MCLFGMVAAECCILDPVSRAELCESFYDFQIWLTRVLAKARKEGELSFAGKPRDEARFMISSPNGAILIARTYPDSERFETAVEAVALEACAAGTLPVAK